MILPSFLALSLIVPTALDMRASAELRVTLQEQDATPLLSLVQRATVCIIRAVKADPRYSPNIGAAAINSLIVDSFSTCRQPVRAMIDAHDRLYGNGSGDAFLLGPYLDILPAAVIKQVRMPR